MNTPPAASKFRFLLLVLFLLPFIMQPLCLPAQESEKTFKQDDVFSIFVKKEKRAKRDSALKIPIKIKKPYFAVTPFVGYNPAYGFLIGVGTTMGIYLGDLATTPVSSVCAAINLTTADQTIITVRSNIITNTSKYILRGDWRYLVFSQPTYGLGTGIKMHTNRGIIFNDGGSTASLPPDAQPLNYDYIRLYETFYFRVIKKWYLGIGYCLDAYSNIVDHNHVDSVPPQNTSHYKYSTDRGFNPEKYTMSGLSLEVLLDSRDNSIRPTKGYLANIAFRPNFTFLGSNKNSLMLNTEFRTYISFSKRRPDHLIGFWYLGQFCEKGTVPYLGLPALCWDMYNRAGRGYIQGSIRGVNFVYGETEWRFPISPYSGILGGCAFVNVTTASSDDGTHKLFQYWDPAAGVGLRIMFSRETLSNLCIDFGFGADGTKGIFFNLNETF
ncbi:MAG: BamA/TamA family outer membrane protein [Bacteroidetes bacterium]|nr:BamA/TamA family outer membrane protein [Bacteroidota bacterium]